MAPTAFAHALARGDNPSQEVPRMLGHPIPWLLGVLVGFAAAVVAAVATRVQLLPEVIDLSIVSTAGVGSASPCST